MLQGIPAAVSSDSTTWLDDDVTADSPVLQESCRERAVSVLWGGGSYPRPALCRSLRQKTPLAVGYKLLAGYVSVKGCRFVFV